MRGVILENTSIFCTVHSFLLKSKWKIKHVGPKGKWHLSLPISFLPYKECFLCHFSTPVISHFTLSFWIEWTLTKKHVKGERNKDGEAKIRNVWSYFHLNRGQEGLRLHSQWSWFEHFFGGVLLGWLETPNRWLRQFSISIARN